VSNQLGLPADFHEVSNGTERPLRVDERGHRACTKLVIERKSPATSVAAKLVEQERAVNRLQRLECGLPGPYHLLGAGNMSTYPPALETEQHR
jgi:hypothetical protein